jgi:simple sugar transport system ATP-binding protein
MGLSIRFDGITKTFGEVVANDGIDLEIASGSVHAILGENGAGKTTLMNVLYGMYQPDRGTVYVDGTPVDFEDPRDAIDAGIGMIHQHFKLVDNMTVTENIILGQEPEKLIGGVTDMRRAREEVRELAERYGFEIEPDDVIEEIALGVQQRVEILKAIYRGADLLILDEPTAALTPQEVEQLYDLLEELGEAGKTIIFISHKLNEAIRVADAITVLRDGKKIATVLAEETSREELAEMMVGREVLLEVDKQPHPPGDPLLTVRDLTVTGKGDMQDVTGVDLELQAGEILGIAGVDGNGQTELAEAIAGMREIDRGSIELDGREITELSRRERIDEQLVYIPQDRQNQGLIMDFDLAENAVLARQHRRPFGVPCSDAEKAAEIIETYNVKASDVTAGAKSLSGGNQQRFIVGRELSDDPRVVVANNPTRGIDVGSISFIHDRILALRKNDVGFLLISSKLNELKQLADRLAVIYEGEVMAVVDPETTTDREIGLLMAGQQPEPERTEARASSAEN